MDPDKQRQRHEALRRAALEDAGAQRDQRRKVLRRLGWALLGLVALGLAWFLWQSAVGLRIMRG